MTRVEGILDSISNINLGKQVSRRGFIVASTLGVTFLTTGGASAQ